MSASRTGRRFMPCYNPAHRHRSAAGAARCQVTTRLSNWQPGAAALLSFEQARARWRAIPAEERDDEEQQPIKRGQFPWRVVLKTLASYLLGAAVGALCLALALAAAVGLVLAVVWVGVTGHEIYAAYAVVLAALAIVGVQVVQVPRVRKGLEWIREAYS